MTAKQWLLIVLPALIGVVGSVLLYWHFRPRTQAIQWDNRTDFAITEGVTVYFPPGTYQATQRTLWVDGERVQVMSVRPVAEAAPQVEMKMQIINPYTGEVGALAAPADGPDTARGR
jgi:hypothetical protein